MLTPSLNIAHILILSILFESVLMYQNLTALKLIVPQLQVEFCLHLTKVTTAWQK